MKAWAAIVVTVLSFACVSQAQDVQVNLGTVTIPDAHRTDVQAWIDYQPPLYTQILVTVTNQGVETNQWQAVPIPETALAKARRVIRTEARLSLRREIRRWLTWKRKRDLNRIDLVADE